MATAVTFADLLREQEEYSGRIQRFLLNVKKLGKEKLTKNLLEQRQMLLHRYWNDFLLGHRQLMRCQEAPASSYVQQDLFATTEDAYLNTAAIISQSLEEMASPSATQTASNSSVTLVQPQLPKIPLPTFSGDPLHWESFRDLFKSLVHDVVQLPDVQKLLYLKSSLTGEAADVIRNTPITEHGYQGAWTDLEIRYGNVRLLSFSHHRALLSCPPAKQQSANELKRLLDTFRQTIRAYSSLSKPVQSWDEWFVFLLTQKLDKVTLMAWETSLLDNTKIPQFQQLASFLENRIQALGAAGVSEAVLGSTSSKEARRPVEGHAKTYQDHPSKGFQTSVYAAASKTPPGRQCPLCYGNHALCYCFKFKGLALEQRKELVQRSKVCSNCLNSGHDLPQCPSHQTCFTCRGRHHTLLHEGAAPAVTLSPTPASTITEPGPSMDDDQHQATTLSLSTGHRAVALLATAKVTLESPSGQTLTVRALLDTGSDSSLVSSWVAQVLRLPRRAVRVSIAGVQENPLGVATSEVSIIARPNHSTEFQLPVRALVLRRLTSLLPVHRVIPQAWPHLDGLELADPEYGVPARIDLILGADVCGQLFGGQSRTGPPGSPTAQLTPFGWVLMGPCFTKDEPTERAAQLLHCQSEDTTNQLLQRFWEMEELSNVTPRSAEEEQCEHHFRSTHTRDHTGRYIVRLPFLREPSSALGNSKDAALKLLLGCERRLAADPNLRQQYINFLTEYLSLQHMEPSPSPADQQAYFLPHHAVRKRHDPSAKLRVVFNASFNTTSGLSLNDCLATGPKLQADLWMILTRWRLFRIVFTADIVKMYRQIMVHRDDIKWQQILWRTHNQESVESFQLTTVTYGTACAPFLALRVLVQLAEDERHRFPLGAQAIERHTYVDDILYGADTEDQALQRKQELISILQAGGFALSKWASNLPILSEINPSNPLVFQEWATVSTLGVTWNPKEDTLSLRVASSAEATGRTTKRKILAAIASMFDPLGWCAPVLVTAKILMQDLWILGVDWDQELPSRIVSHWNSFQKSLSELDSLSIPRWTHASQADETRMELHGFCDASQRAYAAAVYLRVETNEAVHVSLLVAKTKVAPVKTVTIPKLELCGAVLLAKLLTQVQRGLAIPCEVHAWSDSSVTLYWIQGHASQWKPFVAHRVASIQNLVSPEHWHHVRSSDNPADLATRGLTPQELVSSQLWWKGPSWLRDKPDFWPASSPETAHGAEEERRRVILHIQQDPDPGNLLARFSTLSRLLCVIAQCFRFLQRSRRQPVEQDFIKAQERAHALRVALQMSQRSAFHEEIVHLKQLRTLNKGSSLVSLKPFLDEQGLLRVGGRLDAATLPYNEKHPYLLAKTCPLARLLVRDAHLRTLHGGPQLTRSHLLRNVWIVHGRSLVRSEIAACVRCARFSGRSAEQEMGQLPHHRTNPQRPFLSTGVDYAGPIKLRTTAGRGHKAYKGYIALFVCLATKAIHLEAVSDLTSASFLAAFRRFVGRRGRCSTLVSDNGSVFQGADRELRSMFRQATTFYQEVAAALASDGTSWHFIPPYAPHFGGLWEAGVKSVKYHLRRVIGDTTLTYEEMSTFLCQVEACLNSRPLYALSDDPLELAALTPGHFLVGEPTTVLPEPANPDTALGSRWRRLVAMRNQFWQRWRRDYLQQLQQLPKWRHHRENLKIGSLALIRDDLQPPAKWAMGRISALHPGPDGQVRVVTLITAKGTTRRPIVKLCPLPVATD